MSSKPHMVLLTKCLIRMGEEESVCCQGEEIDQICNQVDDEDCSSIFAPLVIQQTYHHRVS